MIVKVIDQVKDYFDQGVKDLVENYERLGLKASGQYEKELKSIVTQSGTKINAKIQAPLQAWFMEHGRGPNKIQNVQAVRNLGWYLKQWVKDKGIDVNPYAAAHKIVYEGIKVPNPHNPGGAISEVINDEWFEKLTELLKYNIIEQIRSDVLKQFKS